jgi:hypothetical protein
MRQWLTVIVVAFAIASLAAQRQVRLWVLQAPDRLVEYDVMSFQERSSIVVPQYVVKHPEYLKITATGQGLFELPRGLALGDAPELSGRIWFWDGTRGRELASQDRDAFLAADGGSLVWFANSFATDVDRDGVERTVRTSARVWQTDLNGGNEATLVSIPPAPSCQCSTGTCSESCPEWTMWAPAGGVDTAFILTQFTPGQLQSSYERSVLYRRAGSRWQPTPLASPLERVLASDPAAEMLIEAVPDGGCCGWINESSDQTALVQGGRRTVLFDEFTRFANADYDISFYTVAASISPARSVIAHTVHADLLEDEIRLSADGKANPAALARIRSAIAEMPTTEIIQLGAPPKTVGTIRKAHAIGWLNDRELLVVDDGVVAIYDARGTKLRTTTIHVSGAAAFLR